MTPELPKGEPPIEAVLQACYQYAGHLSTQPGNTDKHPLTMWPAIAADSLRSRTRTQRERLEKVRDEMRGPCGDQVKLNGREIFRGVPMETVTKWLAALDSILQEEGT